MIIGGSVVKTETIGEKPEVVEKKKSRGVGRPRKSSWGLHISQSSDGGLYLPITYSETFLSDGTILRRFFASVDKTTREVQSCYRKSSGGLFVSDQGQEGYLVRRQYFCRIGGPYIPVGISVVCDASGELVEYKVNYLRFDSFPRGAGVATTVTLSDEASFDAGLLPVAVARGGREAYVMFGKSQEVEVEGEVKVEGTAVDNVVDNSVDNVAAEDVNAAEAVAEDGSSLSEAPNLGYSSDNEVYNDDVLVLDF